MDAEHDETVSRITGDLRTGLEAIESWLPTLETDPGKALAYLTWLGLQFASRCQVMAEHVIDEVDDSGKRRFYSMEGALFRSTGTVVTVDPEFFNIATAIDAPA